MLSFSNNGQATVRTKKTLREQMVFPIQVNSRSLPKGGIQTIIWVEQGTSDATYAKAVAVLTEAGYRDISVSARSGFLSACSGLTFVEAAHAEALEMVSDVAPVPAKLCAHGIDASRRCSICTEDTQPEVKQSRKPTIRIYTAGELHPAPVIEGRITFTFNLSELLDDPARKPDADLVKRDGTDYRMQDFVFFSDGALDLYEDMIRLIEHQVTRGKDVTVLVLCRGGKHRSVAFGENLAAHFEVLAVHHHRHLPIVVAS